MLNIYLQTWRCDEVLFVFDNADATDATVKAELYYRHLCANLEPDDPVRLHVTVQAAVNGGPLGLGSSVRATFGMALWLAIVIHIIGIEYYVRFIRILDRSIQNLIPQIAFG
jgi:hypothetical protein